MQKLRTVLPLLVLLTGCGAAPTSVDTTSSAPQATANNSVKPTLMKAEIPEAEPQTQVKVQRASLSTPARTNTPLQTDITSVVFSRTSNQRTPANQWMHKELRLNHDLTVVLRDYNKQGRVVSQKQGSLPENEYLALVGSLKGARYQTLNPSKRPKALLGNVTDVMTISTAGDFRQFKEDERQQFPAVLQTIFNRYTKAR